MKANFMSDSSANQCLKLQKNKRKSEFFLIFGCKQSQEISWIYRCEIPKVSNDEKINGWFNLRNLFAVLDIKLSMVRYQ